MKKSRPDKERIPEKILEPPPVHQSCYSNVCIYIDRCNNYITGSRLYRGPIVNHTISFIRILHGFIILS